MKESIETSGEEIEMLQYSLNQSREKKNPTQFLLQKYKEKKQLGEKKERKREKE